MPEITPETRLFQIAFQRQRVPNLACVDAPRPTGRRVGVGIVVVLLGFMLIVLSGCERTTGESPTFNVLSTSPAGQVLGRGPVLEEELHESHRAHLSSAGLKDDKKDSSIRKKQTLTAVSLPTWMTPFHKALDAQSNPVHGQTIFARACKNCHRLEGDGYQVGADLNRVHLKSDEQLMWDILEPSREIKPEFRTCSVVTTDGFVSNGILDAESETSLTLRKENGIKQVIFRSDIEVIKQTETSLMPGNLGDQLRPGELADLIAYLRQASASHE